MKDKHGKRSLRCVDAGARCRRLGAHSFHWLVAISHRRGIGRNQRRVSVLCITLSSLYPTRPSAGPGADDGHGVDEGGAACARRCAAPRLARPWPGGHGEPWLLGVGSLCEHVGQGYMRERHLSGRVLRRRRAASPAAPPSLSSILLPCLSRAPALLSVCCVLPPAVAARWRSTWPRRWPTCTARSRCCIPTSNPGGPSRAGVALQCAYATVSHSDHSWSPGGPPLSTSAESFGEPVIS